MALQVWLPLNGNLKNKGIYNETITSSNFSANSNGKIGMCIKCSTSSLIDTKIPSSVWDFTTKSISFGGWVKINQTELAEKTSTYTYSGRYTTCGGTLFGRQSYGGFGLRWKTNDLTNNTIPTNVYLYVYIRDSNSHILSTGTIDLPFDIWTHVFIVFDRKNSTLKFYRNGELFQSKNVDLETYVKTGNINQGTFLINQNSWDGGNGNAACAPWFINDFRLYDHALSAVEVKEISRSLIVHYKLNHIYNNNLIPFSLTTDNYTITNYSSRTPGTINNGIYHVDGYQSETSIDTYFSIRSNTYLTLSADSDYYLSFYCKAANSVSDLFFGVSGQAYTGLIDSSNKHFYPSSQVNLGKNYKGYVVLKIHTGSDTQYKINIGFDSPNLYGIGSYMEFSKIMLTSVEPDLNSPCNKNIILDSSGYNNHGTISGNLMLSDDTFRYNSSINLTDNNGSIGIGNLTKLVPTGEFTFNIWFKKITGEWSTKTWETILGGPSGFELEGKLSNTQNAYIHPYSWGGGSTTTPNTYSIAYDLDVWNMLTMVRTNSNTKFYLNGELKITGSKGSFPSGNYFIGAWKTATQQNYKGRFSDARIYATALSEEDIKQLYEVSAKIDKSGNLHSYEFNELHVGRELLVRNITNGYTSTTSTYTNYSEEGIEFNRQGVSAGSDYIEINPSTNKYVYDYTISVSTGNQFYIGFERYDENKTTRSNQACVYTFSKKPTSDIVKQRYTGVVNLATDGVNPCKYIRLRILNGWTGTDSSSTKLAIIHNLSLREVPTSTTAKTKLYKTGIFESDLLLEGNTKVEIEKNLNANVNQFIET